MLRPFALYRPTTVAEASELLAREGADASLYAGGTEVLLILKEGLLRVGSLIDVKRVPGLGAIRADNGHLSIGATATHRAVEGDATVRARCPLVAGVARHVANIRVRSVGTVGGNLAFADPHSDLATVFLALAAREVDPTTDRHGSAEYKRAMTGVFVRRTLLVAAARAAGRDTHERHPHTVIV